jgi:hypothetical protein
MNSDDIAKAAARLAAIISERPPSLVTTTQDLLAYAEYVEVEAGLKAWLAWEELFWIKFDADPAEAKRILADSNARADRRMNRQAGLVEGRKRAVKTRRQQGEQTRGRVKAALRLCIDRPKHEQATLIADRLGMPAKTVRYWLRRIRQTDS